MQTAASSRTKESANVLQWFFTYYVLVTEPCQQIVEEMNGKQARRRKQASNHGSGKEEKKRKQKGKRTQNGAVGEL